MTTLDLGPKLPQLLSCSLPWQDELGLWFDVDVEFKSICTATVQTLGRQSDALGLYCGCTNAFEFYIYVKPKTKLILSGEQTAQYLR